MKKLFALGAAAVFALGLASCGKNTVKLVYSGTESDKVFNEGLFEDFKKQMAAEGDTHTYEITYVGHGPDVVDSEVIDWDVDKAPDVFEFASDKIASLYSKSAISKIYGENATFIENEMTDFGKACAKFGDAYYAYPYTGDNTYYLQYDKSVITDPADAADMMKLLDAAHAKGYKVGYDLKSGFWGAAAMFTFGADYNIKFSEDGTIIDVTADFNSEKGLKAAKAILAIVNHPAFQNTSGVPTPSDKICAVIGGTWNISTYDKEKDQHGGYKYIWGDNYGCAVMPTVTIDNETRHLGAFLGGKLLGVNPQKAKGTSEEKAAHLQAAHKLAKFLAGKECQLKRFQNAAIAPCHKEAAKDPAVLASPNVAVLAAQAEFAHAQTSVPQGVWDAPSVFVEAMIKGECTEANLQKYIDEYNKTVIGK